MAFASILASTCTYFTNRDTLIPRPQHENLTSRPTSYRSYSEARRAYSGTNNEWATGGSTDCSQSEHSSGSMRSSADTTTTEQSTGVRDISKSNDSSKNDGQTYTSIPTCNSKSALSRVTSGNQGANERLSKVTYLDLGWVVEKPVMRWNREGFYLDAPTTEETKNMQFLQLDQEAAVRKRGCVAYLDLYNPFEATPQEFIDFEDRDENDSEAISDGTGGEATPEVGGTVPEGPRSCTALSSWDSWERSKGKEDGDDKQKLGKRQRLKKFAKTLGAFARR